jgi:hypothetical protein
MVTVVKVNNRNALSLKVVATGGSIKPSTQADAVTVTSAIATGGGGGGATRLDSLVDVVESNPQNNSTLVYYSANDTYVVEQLNLDGGSF